VMPSLLSATRKLDTIVELISPWANRFRYSSYELHSRSIRLGIVPSYAGMTCCWHEYKQA
jgi:hypothetical protein